MLAVYKKELRSYFTSMIGYVYLAILLVIIGYFFSKYNLYGQYANFEYALSDASIWAILVIPVLTMRLMAEENRQKTDQLLYTSPLSASGIIIGKFLSVCTMLGLAMLLSCVYPVLLSLYGEVYYPSAYVAIFGFFLLGAAYMSLGLFFSSLTDSQVIAAVITFVVFLITILMSELVTMLPGDSKSALVVFCILIILFAILLYMMMKNVAVSVIVAIIGIGCLITGYVIKPSIFDGSLYNVFSWLSVYARYRSFYQGIFDISNVVYYCSIIFIFLFLSVQSIKKKRWS